MIEQLLGYMRCPKCFATALRSQEEGVLCSDCGSAYPYRQGILDMMPDEAAEVITPFQRIMQTPLVVAVYESFWRRAGYFIASSRSFDRELDSILSLQRSGNAGRLLDLACGTGVFTRPLARNTEALVVGLDLSWPMLQRARRLADREGLKNIFLIRGTAFRIPFIAGAFPGINCCGALHLFDQPEKALEEIVRVLHSAGHLSVQTTIRPKKSGGTAFILEKLIRFGFFAEDELRETIRLHGLKVLESERNRISFTFLARPVA